MYPKWNCYLTTLKGLIGEVKGTFNIKLNIILFPRSDVHDNQLMDRIENGEEYKIYSWKDGGKRLNMIYPISD